MLGVSNQTHKMFEQAGEALLQHLLFKCRDIMNRIGIGLLGKILTTVFEVNDKIFDNIDSLQHDQLGTKTFYSTLG